MSSLLKKSLTAIALAGCGSVLAGLNPAPAQACGTYTIAQIAAPGFSDTCGDKLFDNFSSVSFGSAPGTVTFSDSGLLHNVNFVFAPGIGLGTYSLDYDVNILSTNDLASLDTMIVATGNPALANSTLDPLPPLSSGVPTYTLTGTLEVLNASTEVTEWNHMIVQTPGPLPILGAGAAFGFSRKLRKRIKQSA